MSTNTYFELGLGSFDKHHMFVISPTRFLLIANQASRQFDEKLGKIDDYMRTKKLPAAMREKVGL